MFTGIIQELGVVRKVEKRGNSSKLEIGSTEVSKAVKLGDSVSVNGVCLTAIFNSNGTLAFDVMAETMRSANFTSLKAGDRVNLEGALRASGSIDGHFVLGHIDCVGVIRDVKSSRSEFAISVEFPPEFNNMVVDKGSIAVDGVSLTVNDPRDGVFRINLIPHTLKATTLTIKRPSDKVNLEFDIIGKYIERRRALEGSSGITEEYLKSKGF